jgi:putative transposase
MEKIWYIWQYFKCFKQKSSDKGGQRRHAVLDDHWYAVCKDGTKRGSKGYDGGKKVKGRKRLLAVDTLGLIHGIHVGSAAEHDTKLAAPLFEKMQGKFPRVRKVLADKGFRGDELRRLATLKLNSLLEIKESKKEDVLKNTENTPILKGFQVIPYRWIIERTNAWIIFCRRLAKDYEHNTLTSKAFIAIATIRRNLRLLNC